MRRMERTALDESNLPFPLFRRGKVRDVYDLGETLLFVATDRISAFDVVLQPGVPGKGTILTQISNFWFRKFEQVENHLVETEWNRLPREVTRHSELEGRAVIVKKCEVLPVECVARGYLVGSGWKEYEQQQSVCGIPLPAGLRLGEKLPEVIFTPATKAETGHDQNISFQEMSRIVGAQQAETLRERTLEIYGHAVKYAAGKGIIIADTKFEFGLFENRLIWIDEALTPDSSRFWPAESYRPGSNPPSYDKQFVRDWLESTGWDKRPPAPPLPQAVIEDTRVKYEQAFERLTNGEC